MKTSSYVRFVSLLLLAGALVACKKEEAQPQQTPLLINGDIEQSSQGWLFNYDNYHLKNPNGYTLTYSTEAASSPTHSLKISCSNVVVADSTFCFFGQDNISTSNIPVGAKLTLKAKIKTALTGPGVSIAIRGDKGTSTPLFVTTQNKTQITGTQDFTEYSVVVNSFPGNIDNLLIFLVYLPNTTGAVYFDDVSLIVN